MPLPASGHVNPMSGMAHELAKTNQVVFYGNEEHRSLIEKTGAEFRMYQHFPKSVLQPKQVQRVQFKSGLILLQRLIDVSYKEIPLLIKDIERDKPDLIIYDHFSIPVKFALKVMETNFKKSTSFYKPPPTVLFFTTFSTKKNVYPCKVVKHSRHQSVWSFIPFIYLIFKQIIFSMKFGIDVIDTMNFLFEKTEDLNIVSVFPELQPNSDKFDESFKFVGCCVSESVRKSSIIDPRLKEILDLFDPINPVDSIESTKSGNNKTKLVYVSLGTIFNINTFIIDKIIDAVNILNQSNELNLIFVISLSEEFYLVYQDKIRNSILDVPSNILLMPVVPQIDVLERASLFITHAGMNSSIEAIHYAVPVICLPISFDQPSVSFRIADQLGLGKSFDPLDVTPFVLSEAIQDVLNDKSYLKRMLDFSKISRKYDGKINSTKLVLDYMQKFDKKNV